MSTDNPMDDADNMRFAKMFRDNNDICHYLTIYWFAPWHQFVVSHEKPNHHNCEPGAVALTDTYEDALPILRAVETALMRGETLTYID